MKSWLTSSSFLIPSFPGLYPTFSVSLAWRPKGTATDHKKSDGGGRENQKQKFRARANVPPKHLCKVKPKEKTSCMTVKYSVSVYLHSLKSSKRSKADFTVGNIYFWLTIFRNDRVLLSCTVGPSFRNWIYEVVFNMFLSVEGENPLLELEKRRQVQRLMNNSWRKTKCINAARLAQLVEHWSAEREVVASTPAEPTTRVFKKLVRSCWLLFKTLSQLRWSRRWVVTLSRWPWVEMLHTILLIGLNSKS